jgi:hypothetical protein
MKISSFSDPPAMVVKPIQLIILQNSMYLLFFIAVVNPSAGLALPPKSDETGDPVDGAVTDCLLLAQLTIDPAYVTMNLNGSVDLPSGLSWWLAST